MSDSSDGRSKLVPEQGSERIALLAQLRNAERRAVSSRVASLIGHMIGTPLNVIAGRAALIRADPRPESAADNARRIEEQTQRLARRISRLIEYLATPDSEATPKSASAIVEQALSLYAPLGERRDVKLEWSGGAPDARVADAGSALIVLTNMLSLAIRLAPPQTSAKLTVRPGREGALVFDLLVPGVTPLPGRIDSLEPPEEEGMREPEQRQDLALCSAIAKRHGGQLSQLAADGANGTVLRFECPSL